MTKKEFCESQLTNELGKPYQYLPWWEELDQAQNENIMTVVNTVRQQGKTSYEAVDAHHDLFHKPNAQMLFLACALNQASRIFEQKFRRPILSNPKLERDAEVLKDTIRVPRMGTMIRIIPSSEFTAPGESLTKIYIDEARWLPDSVFAAIVPSIISTGGRIIISSTAGSPSGWFYKLVTNPKKGTYIFRSSDILNPHTSTRMMDFAQDQLRDLLPGLYQREFQNEFAELGDEFLSAEAIDQCTDLNLTDKESSESPCFSFWDLSAKRDLTSRVIVEESEDGALKVANIFILDPQKLPNRRMDFSLVRDRIILDNERFNIVRMAVDERAEASELVSWMIRENIAHELYNATAKSNMELWGALSSRINNQTLIIPNNARIQSELRGLRIEEFSYGKAWRVVDSSSRIHRDVSMALAGAVWLAEEQSRRPKQFDDVLWLQTGPRDRSNPFSRL